MTRQPEPGLPPPELRSTAGTSGFNRVVVHKFCDMLENIFDENKVTASKIFNVDQTT
jgi:hypothetical protein